MPPAARGHGGIKKDFCKNCIGGFGLFAVILIFVVHRGNEHAIFCSHALFHILTAYLCLSNTMDIDFVLGIKGTLIRDLIMALDTDANF